MVRARLLQSVPLGSRSSNALPVLEGGGAPLTGGLAVLPPGCLVRLVLRRAHAFVTEQSSLGAGNGLFACVGVGIERTPMPKWADGNGATASPEQPPLGLESCRRERGYASAACTPLDAQAPVLLPRRALRGTRTTSRRPPRLHSMRSLRRSRCGLHEQRGKSLSPPLAGSSLAASELFLREAKEDAFHHR